MPVIYKFGPVDNFIYTRCLGDIALDDARNHLQVLQMDPLCPPVLNVLLDLSETTSVPDTDDLRLISEEIGRVRTIQFNACAIFAPDDHFFGMARIFAVFARNRFVAMHVFRTIANAERWLDSFQPPASSK